MHEVMTGDTASEELAAIAQRWQGYQRWCAPIRNRLWVETLTGQPIAAVSCTPAELVTGELERRRQMLAHAPEDIQTLLEVVRLLKQRCALLEEAAGDDNQRSALRAAA